jgi:hypothetical protein
MPELAPHILDHLTVIRTAARSREWNLLQPALAALLGELDKFTAVDFVIERLNRHLPTFQEYHPDDANPPGKMVRELMITVVSFGFAPENLPDFLVGDYPTPGSGQYVHAVLELCRAMQKDRTPDEVRELLASAVANSLLAELSEFWYSRNPEAYARVRANEADPRTGEYSDPEAARIPLLFWLDDQVAARDTGAWLNIAYKLEKRLK